MIQQQVAVVLWIALTVISGTECTYRFMQEGAASLWGWLLLPACLFSLVMVFRSRKKRGQEFGISGKNKKKK